MKINLQKELTRWGLITLLAAVLVGFTQCVGSESSSTDDSYHSETLTGGGLEAEEEEAPEVGIKDADRIFQTMSVLTGVPTTNTTVRDIFRSDYKAQLPNSARVEAMLETHILGATKLATEFCQQLISNTNLVTARDAIWPPGVFNFTAAPATAFGVGSNSRGQFISRMLERFWGVDVLPPEEYEEAYDVIDDLITEAMNGQTANATGTQNIAKIACSAALSAPQVIMQ